MVTSIPFLVAKITDDNDFLKLKEKALVHDFWRLEYEKCGIKIWSRALSDATVKMVKVWAIFSGIKSFELYNALMDSTYRKQWDNHLLMDYEIGHLNANNAVSYYAASCPPPLKSRDFVLQTSWLDKKSEHFIFNHSVCHKDHPPRSGFIRAISYFTGFYIKSFPENGTELTFVSQTDPQGIIPTWIVNKCTQIFAPRYVKRIEKAALDYGEWKSQNNPTYLPWVFPEQMKSPKISITDCVPSEEEKQSSFFKYLAEKELKQTLNVDDYGVLSRNMMAAGTSAVQYDSKDRLKTYQGSSHATKDTKKKNKTKDGLGYFSGKKFSPNLFWRKFSA